MAALPAVKSGDYLVVASGHAPYLAGWQEFKDYIRQAVKEQPGWTQVNEAPVLSGKPKGEKQGWCRLKDKEDADAVYNIFARSRGILVHVFSTSLRSGQFEMVRCNCMIHFPNVGDRGHSSQLSGIDVNSVNQTFETCFAVSKAQYNPAVIPNSYSYGQYYQPPRYAPVAPMYQTYPSYQVQPAAPPLPAYSQSASGLPVNLSRGAAITESRGILIKGLNYSARDDHLWALVASFGLRPIEAKVKKDHHGNSKGVATVKFSSQREALDGVKYLHKQRHMEKTLSVRLDVESTVVGHIDPLVVDGTNKMASLTL